MVCPVSQRWSGPSRRHLHQVRGVQSCRLSVMLCLHPPRQALPWLRVCESLCPALGRALQRVACAQSLRQCLSSVFCVHVQSWWLQNRISSAHSGDGRLWSPAAAQPRAEPGQALCLLGIGSLAPQSNARVTLGAKQS